MNDTIRTPGRLTTVGPAVKKLNPQVFGPVGMKRLQCTNCLGWFYERGGDELDIPAGQRCLCGDRSTVIAKPKKRLRQSSKPVLNGLETAWRDVLRATLPGTAIREQARRYKIANGSWYRPDLTAIVAGQETAWECKGPKEMRGVAKGTMTIKVAAHLWPEVRWILVYKRDGQWVTETILP